MLAQSDLHKFKMARSFTHRIQVLACLSDQLLEGKVEQVPWGGKRHQGPALSSRKDSNFSGPHLAVEREERHGLFCEAGPLLDQLHLELVPIHRNTAAQSTQKVGQVHLESDAVIVLAADAVVVKDCILRQPAKTSFSSALRVTQQCRDAISKKKAGQLQLLITNH